MNLGDIFTVCTYVNNAISRFEMDSKWHDQNCIATLYVKSPFCLPSLLPIL
jgi:hypothetical protein